MFKPGTLTDAVNSSSAQALASGALQPVHTRLEWVTDSGVDFCVRVVGKFAGREGAKLAVSPGVPAQQVNPFLPHDPQLFVADLSDTHLLLLNKYNVAVNHLLIVTRQFEEQESPINAGDFTAVWQCLAEIDGLVFHNAGAVSGASQRHKHLQLLPLPLAPEGPAIPCKPLLDAASFNGLVAASPALPFRHAFAMLDPGLAKAPVRAGQVTAERYELLRRTLGCGDSGYNLLLTRQWMLLIPRLRADCEGISVNALGFVGAMLARDDTQLAQIRQLGPMNILRAVTEPLRL